MVTMTSWWTARRLYVFAVRRIAFASWTGDRDLGGCAVVGQELVSVLGACAAVEAVGGGRVAVGRGDLEPLVLDLDVHGVQQGERGVRAGERDRAVECSAQAVDAGGDGGGHGVSPSFGLSS
jgi:adenine deaminase